MYLFCWPLVFMYMSLRELHRTFSINILVMLYWVACAFILRETDFGAELSSCVCHCDVEFQLLWSDWNLISKIVCDSWEIRMYFCSPRSWLAYIVPVPLFLLAGMFHRLPSSLLQCRSFRMWQSRVQLVLLISSKYIETMIFFML